jgi:2'-5' RNA ligase
MRLFLAMEPSQSVQMRIFSDLESFRNQHPELKWVSSENLHVTLRFLGDRSPDSVISELALFNPSSCLPVEFTLNKSGTFGVPPSVLWLSGEFPEGIYTLAATVSTLPDQEGRTEKRPFSPHISVARAPRNSCLPSVNWHGQIAGVFQEVKLISSVLLSHGPVYSTLKTWRV